MQKIRTYAAIIQIAFVLNASPSFAQAASMPASSSAISSAQPSSAQTSSAQTSSARTGSTGSLLDDLDALEKSVFGKKKSGTLTDRVAKLEITASGKQHEGSLRTRVDSLKHIIQTGEAENAPAFSMSADTKAHIPASLSGDNTDPSSNNPAQDVLTGKVESNAVTGSTQQNSSQPSDAALSQLDAVLSGGVGAAGQSETAMNRGYTDAYVAPTAPPIAAPLPGRSIPQSEQQPFPAGQLGFQPATQVALPHIHPHARAFAHNFGIALNATLRTAAMVAGTAAAAYVNSSYSYGTASYGTRDLCACHYHRGF